MAKFLFLLDSKDYGGAESYILAMINLMIKTNRITVITRKSRFSEMIATDPQITLLEEDFDNLLKVKFQVERIISEYDICFCVRWKAIAVGSMVKKKIDFKMISMIMTVFEPGTRADGNNNIKRDIELISMLNEYSNKIIVTANCAKESIVNYGVKDEKIFILNDAIDDIKSFEIKGNDNRQKIKIAYCGRLSYEKGPDILLEAFCHLVKEKKIIRDIELHYIGEGLMKKGLTEFVKQYDIEQYVIFHGFVTKPQLVMKDMDFLVIPSRHDAIPLSAIEAMCLEKPVVAARIGGLPECVINTENGYLYEDKEELREVLYKMTLLEPFELERMGKKSREIWLEKFSIDKFASGIKKVCDEVIKQ